MKVFLTAHLVQIEAALLFIVMLLLVGCLLLIRKIRLNGEAFYGSARHQFRALSERITALEQKGAP